jgi:hypothetical protein
MPDPMMTVVRGTRLVNSALYPPSRVRLLVITRFSVKVSSRTWRISPWSAALIAVCIAEKSQPLEQTVHVAVGAAEETPTKTTRSTPKTAILKATTPRILTKQNELYNVSLNELDILGYPPLLDFIHLQIKKTSNLALTISVAITSAANSSSTSCLITILSSN